MVRRGVRPVRIGIADERRCHTLPLPVRRQEGNFLTPVSPVVRKFPVSGGLPRGLPVTPVVRHTMAGSTMSAIVLSWPRGYPVANSEDVPPNLDGGAEGDQSRRFNWGRRYHVADGFRAREHHDDAVDANTDAARGRHSIFQCD